MADFLMADFRMRGRPGLYWVSDRRGAAIAALPGETCFKT